MTTLMTMICDRCPRAAAPLWAYAVASNKEEYLLSLSKGTEWDGEYSAMSSLLKNHEWDLVETLEDVKCPYTYGKILLAYNHARDPLMLDRVWRVGMRRRILRAMQEKGFSVADLVRMCGTNKGNTYRYLSHGDERVVSNDVVWRLAESVGIDK